MQARFFNKHNIVNSLPYFYRKQAYACNPAADLY